MAKKRARHPHGIRGRFARWRTRTLTAPSPHAPRTNSLVPARGGCDTMARTLHGSRPRARARRRPHTFRARMVRIMAVSLATALVPLGFLVAADVGAYRAAD